MQILKVYVAVSRRRIVCTVGFNLKTVASMYVTFLKPNWVLSLLMSPFPGRYCECFNYFLIGF